MEVKAVRIEEGPYSLDSGCFTRQEEEPMVEIDDAAMQSTVDVPIRLLREFLVAYDSNK